MFSETSISQKTAESQGTEEVYKYQTEKSWWGNPSDLDTWTQKLEVSIINWAFQKPQCH